MDIKTRIKAWAQQQRSNLNWNTVNNGMINSVLNNLSRVRRSVRGLGSGSNASNNTTARLAQNIIQKQLEKLSRKSARESKGVEYQWIIIRKTPSGSYDIQPIESQGYAVRNWRLNYVFNKSFPSVKLTALQNNGSENFLRSVFVSSKPCNTTNQNAAGVCGNRGIWSGSNYKVLKNGTRRVIVKKGSASPGVSNLATLIKTAGSAVILRNIPIKAKVLRARYLEAKRNGDYFQIFTCFYVNNDPNVFIMKPGDEDLATQISGPSQISPRGVLLLDKLFTVDKFYFDRCCFWTCDRPAGFFAMLMGVPIIKKAVNVNGAGVRLNYIPDDTLRRYINTVIPSIQELQMNATAKACIVNILTEWSTDQSPITLGSLHTRPWYLKMCIFDSCHDFGHGARSPKELVELIKNVLMSFFPQAAEFINAVFSSIVDMEKIADVVIQGVAVMNGTSYPYETPDNRMMVYNTLFEEFNAKKMCYVYDCGTTPPVTHPFRLFKALLAAKLYDPSS